MVNLRRALLHREHTESVRDRARSLLGDHRSYQLRAETNAEEGSSDDSGRVDIVRCDQFAAFGWLERLAGRIGARDTLSVNQKTGLRDLLVVRLVLYSSVVDEPGVSRDLPSDEKKTERTSQAK